MISAIVLAAGKSSRMGQPKMALPWGNTTLLGKVIDTLQSAGLKDIVVIAGGERALVEKISASYAARVVYNESFENGEMLSSIQCGLRAQMSETQAALICLGDQPQVKERSVRLVCESFMETKSNLVAPSYRNRRGHPWLVARPLWNELLEMKSPQSPRDFFRIHADEIKHIEVDTPTIVEDVDTPQDYAKFKP